MIPTMSQRHAGPDATVNGIRHDPSIGELVARSGPLEITEIAFQDPVLALSGEGWALTAMCPWRVLRGDALELSWSTPDAEDRAWDLIGR